MSRSGKRKDVQRALHGGSRAAVCHTQELLEHWWPQELCTLSLEGALARWDSATAMPAPSSAHACLGIPGRSDRWVALACALPALGCVLASPVGCSSLSSRPWSSLSAGRGSWPCALAVLPMDLLLLAQGATREWSRLLPAPSAGEQGPGVEPRPRSWLFSLLACRTALLDSSRAGCPYLLAFLIFCGLIDDFVITPESATSCCLFPRYNLPLHCLPLNVIRGTFVSATFSCFCNWNFICSWSARNSAETLGLNTHFTAESQYCFNRCSKIVRI